MNTKKRVHHEEHEEREGVDTTAKTVFHHENLERIKKAPREKLKGKSTGEHPSSPRRARRARRVKRTAKQIFTTKDVYIEAPSSKLKGRATARTFFHHEGHEEREGSKKIIKHLYEYKKMY